MARIRLEKVTKKFRDRVVVNEVSLDVGDGEFLCLLGPQGAGKTTILRLIAGLEELSSGSIYFDDEVVNELSPASRDVAMVFQTFALYPQKTVYENLSFPLLKKKMSKKEIDDKVKATAELLRITHLLEKKPQHLSGGEKQRVSLGRALVREPRVFLLDEPLTNLDAKLRLHMRAELKKIQREMGQTAIFSTADDLEAMTMADKIAVVEGGRLQDFGEVYKVYDHPKNIFSAKFVGTPKMNLVDCVLTKTAERAMIDLNGIHVNIPGESKQFDTLDSGSEMVFGIRPSDIQVSEKKLQEDMIGSEVYEVVPEGTNLLLALRVGDKMINAKVPATFDAKHGQTLYLGFPKQAVHLFDKNTENAVL